MEFDREALVQAFLEESAEGLSRMEEALIALEARPDDETLRDIFRQVHTLKGNAASFQFAWLTEFAHVLEDLLARLCAGSLAVTSALVTLLLEAVGALREMVPNAVFGAAEPSLEEERLLTALQAHMAAAFRPSPLPSRAPSVEPDPPHARRTDPAFAPAAREEAGPAHVGRQHGGKTLRVDIGRLDRMLHLLSELTVAQSRVAHAARGLGPAGSGVIDAHEAADRLCLELQEQILKARMVPVGPVFSQYVRIVRDIALAQRKMARLVIKGGDVEIDASVIERFRDPLTHMLRNALDHGIEPLEVREERGKDPCGLLTLRASYDARSVVIEVSDDGAGFQRARIAERARRLGLAADPEALSDRELLELAFAPGLSTADAITSLSGRGIGMDVVRRSVEEMRGSIAVDSREGVGTTITARLPLTVALIEGFCVSVADEQYVIPLDAVVECVALSPAARERRADSGVVQVRGDTLPYLRLRHFFGLGGEPQRRESMVVVRGGGQRAGLAVDEIHGECQTVVKPIGPLFERTPGISGSTILGSGRVALLLDVAGMLAEALRRERGADAELRGAEGGAREQTPR
jgi:two-component system chemotaxis sensor kinase CheA